MSSREINFECLLLSMVLCVMTRDKLARIVCSSSLSLTIGGEVGHRKYDCPQMRTFSANAAVPRWAQAGHFAKDCKVNLAAQGTQGGFANNPADFDKEYQ